MDPIKIVDEYINKKSWKVKADSNSDYSLLGLITHIASKVQGTYWLEKVYSKEVKEAHIKGDIHVHKLDDLATYCCGWDMQDLLMEGYDGVPGKVSCKPPKHLSSALDHVYRFLFSLRRESAYGAQAFSNFDTYLAPFIFFDGLSYKEIKQNIQKFVFDMNLPFDKNFQAPFTNITLDIVPSGTLANESVIIGGKRLSYAYKDFKKEMILFNKAFAEVMTEGDASGRVFTWPIPTYNLTKDFDWDNKELKGIWEMTAKFGIPYFSNFINSDMKPDDVRSMCCRLRIDNRVLIKRGGGLFGSNPLTGSIGYVTLNLPRVGYLSKSKDEYFKNLDRLMELAKQSLLDKRKFLEEMTELGLYPYTRYYLRNIKARFNEYWKNHFNTIAIMGMSESCQNFLGRGKDISTKEGKEFALEVMDHIREVLLKYQEETNQMFNLEATPGEGATYTLAKKDQEQFSDIIFANDKQVKEEGAEPFYSNSTHLPVDSTTDIFEALEHQEELQCKYTGGTVFHAFLGERIESPAVVKKLVKKIAESYKLPYFSITPTFSICSEHGYIAGERYECPKCGKECEVYSRIVGYISPVQRWNKGKEAEWKCRKTYEIH
mgnify:CR=1 FL=1